MLSSISYTVSNQIYAAAIIILHSKINEHKIYVNFVQRILQII